jgi:hypothetical protein
MRTLFFDAKSPSRGGRGVAQVSKPAVSPISKSAGLSVSGDLWVWKSTIQQAWKSEPHWKPALQRSTPCAAPTPVFRSYAEASCHGIVPDIAENSRLLIIIPNPVIVGFRLPERLFAHAQNLLGAARGELFPGFQNVAQQVVRHWPDDSVGVVRHYNPFMQQIPALMKVSHRVSHKISDVGPAQVTSAHALIKIAFHLAAKVARDFFFGIVYDFTSFCESVQSPQAFCFFKFKFQQHLPGQRVSQTKRNKIGRPFALHMRQIPACVKARAQRVGGFVPCSAGAKLTARPLQAGIRRVRCVRLHVKTVINWIAEGERVWKPATQQTWKSALLALR